MTLTPEQVAALGGILGAVVIAGIRQVWVWGWTYKAMVDDRDFWRRHALRSSDLTDRAIDIAAKKGDG
jgi:hypothetical protein